MAKKIPADAQPKKKNKKRGKYTALKIFILICVIAYAGIMIIYQQSTLATEQRRNEELISQRDELASELDYYTNELEYSDSDNYIIKVARERLGWLFSNETKYVETPDATEQDTPANNDSSSTE